jgi:hypothetical protein
MSSQPKPAATAPLDLSKWRNVPMYLMAGGGLLSLVGFVANREQFAFSWLLAFSFGLSLCSGALFLVLFHHLFDAGWSVAIRRTCEHITCQFPWLAVVFLPILFLRKKLYHWMILDPARDHALSAKQPLFTEQMFIVVAVACFAIWIFLSWRLRYWSLQQDVTGDAKPTHKMRTLSCIGIFLFSLSLTLAVIMWVKALQHAWFSTMYGVWFFAGSVWTALATVYVITMILDRKGVLTDVLHEHQYYFIGSLLFAFTVFHAYVTFAQYFIIWNANMPEETFWYVARERGTWFYVSMVIIFGHFFVPFLALLRIDVKSIFAFMVPICAWAWLMQFVDLSFNIMPVLHREGFVLHWMDIGAWAFVIGLLANRFLASYKAHAPYPLKDPRLIEAMGYYHPVPTQISGGELEDTDTFSTAPRHP